MENLENKTAEHVTTVIVQNNMSNALGIASFVFGIISIFFLAPVFVPLAVLFGVIAIIKKQLVWGVVGIICSIIGFATSPILMGFLALARMDMAHDNIDRGVATIPNGSPNVYTPSPRIYPAQPTQAKELSISARDLWIDTGIALSKGESFNIRASGQWTNGGDSPKYVGPAGFNNFTFPGAILGSANLASLIGQINGHMFQIGSNYSAISPDSGNLLVTINDTPDSFSDNNGNLHVQISHSR